ncbi:MAG: hypothetical protein DID91_2727704365 [Candidatus Nitrotoga sp. MKT]|nr:MAG: hypothetical protein DID91_2727704365 [Candidatus Nitrotoga sp. MKT]
MAKIEQRIAALEQQAVNVARQVFMIDCAGATPTPEEQVQIDDADRRGMFVIYRLIVSPLKQSI